MKYLLKIFRYTSRLWPFYLGISIMSVLVALTSLALPLLTGRAIDELQGGASDVRYLVFIAVAILLLDLSSTMFSNIGGYWGDLMSSKAQRILSRNYYEHLLTLPQSYFDTELSGKIINRLNRSISQISSFMQMWSNNFLQFVFSTVFSLAIVAYFSWQIALLLFFLYPIYIWMTVKTSGRWIKYAEKINKHWDLATGRFAEAISQIKVVKSFNQEKRELNFFTKHYNKMIATTYPQSQLWHKRDVQRRVILNIIFFGVYVLIFVQAANNVFTAGQAVALILYAMQIRIPIFTISFLVENTQRAVADSKDYFEVMAVEPTIQDTQHAKQLKVTKGKIEFKNVTFAYQDKRVIKDVSFTIEPDTKIALVGESGEGKTTLTNLLLRLYDPQKGQIIIDDQALLEVSQRSLRKNIGVVFQDPALFSGTIKENIGYAKSTATDKEIEQAAKAANAHEFISKLEKKYETEIGEKGLKLSGGQKQRIAIARALLKDAPILILDEATSSLDSKSELMVQEALQRLMKGRTTLIIAHRLSTIAHVDQIITMKDGSIDEIGSPKQLQKTNGIYARLLALQQGHTKANIEKLKKYEIAG